MFTLMLLLLIAAFVTTLASAMGRCPLWVSQLLLTLAVLCLAYPNRIA